MTLQQLKYVVKVAAYGSFNEASKALFISQPSLSNAIRELETEIKTTIFIRTNRGIHISPEGAEFLGYARQVLQQSELLEEKYLSKGKAKQRFYVSTHHYLFAANAFVDLIKEFGGAEYEFTFRETGTYEVIDDVKNLRSEIGLIYLLEELAAYPCLSFEQGGHYSFYFSEEILSTRSVKKSIKVSDRAAMVNLMIGVNGYTICTGVFYNDADDETIDSAFRENTKAVFGESLANPALTVLNIERFARLAHNHRVPLIVDNTFATPIFCKPISYGADIVIHSTSKYIDGHALQIGGVIVDSGKFDWTNGNFPDFTEPDESYHGISYTTAYQKAAYIIKARMQLIRDFGAYPAANSAFLLNLGLETLAMRMEKYNHNALKIA